MIKAIIFDCFGVLTTEGLTDLLQSDIKESDRQTVRNLTDQANLADITFDEYVARLSKISGLSIDLIHQKLDSHVPNHKLFEYIKSELKPGKKIGMLSNATANWLSELFTPSQIALFDGVALSCEIGFIKPDPKAYMNICNQLGVEPNEAVMVDDIERYVAAAQDIGMKGIFYQSFDQFRADLQAILSS